jgi:hypothetical protein
MRWPGRIVAVLCLAAPACSRDSFAPEGDITIEIHGPERITSRPASDGVTCDLKITAVATGPRTAVAEWKSATISGWGDLQLVQLVDLWGSSRLAGGDSVQSRYIRPISAASQVIITATFRYRNVATGEVRTTSHATLCAP